MNHLTSPIDSSLTWTFPPEIGVRIGRPRNESYGSRSENMG